MLGQEIQIIAAVFRIIKRAENLVLIRGRSGIARDHLVVDIENFVAYFDLVSGYADHALDIIEALVLRIDKDDDVAMLGWIAFDDVNGFVANEVGERNLESIREFIHEDVVADGIL